MVNTEHSAQTTQLQVSRLHYHRQSRTLDITFSDGTVAGFSAEFLRVFSPSAEVRGHGKPKLVSNKKLVNISKLQLVFDDGHDSGIYSWQYLKQLGEQQTELWQQYLAQLDQANANRDDLIAVKVRY
jgi:DUF971 family protein